MKKLTFIIQFLAISILQASQQDRQFDSSFNKEITRTFAKNNIKNCGEYKWMNTNQGNEYWVKCTKDGKTWFNYTVWPASQKVMKGLWDGSKQVTGY